MRSHPIAYAGLVGGIVAILCSLNLSLKPSIRAFWQRQCHFALRYGIPVAPLQALLHLWLVGR